VEQLDTCIFYRLADFTIEAYRIMEERQIPIALSGHNMTELLISLGDAGKFDEGYYILERSIAQGVDPTVHNFSPLLKCAGDSSRASMILQRMHFMGLHPNVISYTTAIKSCEITGDWHSALEIMNLMRGFGISPNAITYCCVISVASKAAAGGVAINLLREMASYGLEPNLLCYGSALLACAKAGMWNDVEDLLGEMELLSLPLRGESFKCQLTTNVVSAG
jgi:pentatricopeptide repeat protein